MKMIHSTGFTRIAPLVVASLGLFAASASALEKASVFIGGKTFSNRKNLTASSVTQPVKQTIARSKIYSYKIDATVGGTGNLAFLPAGTPLGTLFDLIAPGSSSLLTGSVENPTGTLPFTIADQKLSGVEDIKGVGKVSVSARIKLEILADGAVALNVSSFRIKKAGAGLIAGTIKLGAGSKITVNTAPIIRVKLASINVDENDPTGNVLVEVIRAGGFKGAAAKVTYSTSDDTAIAGVDYTAVTDGVIEFAPNQVTKTISIPIINNTEPDAFRRFKVTLATSFENKTVLAPQTTATIGIRNDD